MPMWVWFFIGILTILLLLYFLGRLLPIRFTGRKYFKELLSKEGVDWTYFPEACLNEFVDDSIRYAKLTCSSQNAHTVGRNDFYVEFERMLKIHAAGVSALLKGEGTEGVWEEQDAILKKYGIIADGGVSV